MSIAFEIAVIALLVVLNGWFAMSELAIVSARRVRLAAQAADGSRGARVAMELAQNPARFLSAVQIGITLVGTLAGAYSGTTLAEKLAAWITAESPGLASAAHAIALAVVVGSIAYVTLIVGELVPKQIALANRERVAARVARPMAAIAWIASPLLWTMEYSSRLALRLLGVRKSSEDAVTEEEVRAMIAEGTRIGVFEPEEKELIAGVMRFGDRRIRAVMTPHQEVVGIDLGWERERILRTLRDSSHSRFPVFRGDASDVVGVVQAKDLLDRLLDGQPLDPAPLVKPLPAVPDSAPALDVLDVLKRSPIHMVLVVDEYGTVEGIVTAADILAAIAGSFSEPGEIDGDSMVRREDGSWLVDGDVAVDLAAERIGCPAMTSAEGDYSTVAGFILARSRRLPSAGDHFVWQRWRFEVVDMDSHRIDKVLVSRLEDDDPLEEP